MQGLPLTETSFSHYGLLGPKVPHSGWERLWLDAVQTGQKAYTPPTDELPRYIRPLTQLAPFCPRSISSVIDSSLELYFQVDPQAKLLQEQLEHSEPPRAELQSLWACGQGICLGTQQSAQMLCDPGA